MDHATITELNRRFGIPGIAQVVVGNGGLAKVTIATRNTVGEIYLHGAHVTSWQPRGAEEVLFLSSQSRWEDGRPIRGGIPLCFPWFAGKADDPSATAHGFVRTKTWQLESITQAGDAVTVSMVTESNDQTKRWWPVDFQAAYRATFDSTLKLKLKVRNTGATLFRFEEALHTYFRVGDIEKTRLHGLNTVPYVDKTDSNRKQTQQGSIEIVSETDRVYLNTQGAIDLEDQSLRRRIEVAKENSFTTVIWNPGVEKAKALSDLGNAEWKQLLCIEASNVSDYAVELEPGHEHKMQASVRLALL